MRAPVLSLFAFLLICGFALASIAASPVSAQAANGAVPIKTPDLTKARWPSDSPRRALIIGNSLYQPANRVDALALTDLLNACDDAKSVAQSLISSGWRPVDIVFSCNQTSGALDMALKVLTTTVQKNHGDDQFTLVYLSGHGVQVGKKGYFFGVNARPDFVSAADTVIANHDATLFSDQSTTPMDFIRSTYGPIKATSALIVFFDACRVDPLYDKIKQALIDQAASKSSEQVAIINDLANSVKGATNGGGTLPEGSVILFGSQQGFPVDDDDGVDHHSRMSSGFMASILPAEGKPPISKTAVRVVQGTVSNVTDMILNDPNAEFKKPEPIGIFLQDPCVSYCKAAGQVGANLSSQKLRRALSMGVPTLQRVAYYTAEKQGASQASAVQPAPQPTSPSRTVEIFWCSGDEADQARRQAAVQLGAALEAHKDTIGVANIRISELPPHQNAIVGYQVGDDRTVYNAVDRVAGRSILRLDRSLSARSYLTGSPHYISTFYCKGAYKGVVSVTLYLQTPTYASLPAAGKLIDHLKATRADINVIPQTEVKILSPDTTQIRYFDPNRRAQVEAVASELSTYLGVPMKPTLFSKLKNPRSVNQFEIWLGKSDLPLIERSLIRAPSAFSLAASIN